MSDIPIIDTHLHVWDTNALRYAWLEDVEQLNKPHLLEQYNEATASLNITQMVFLQCEVYQSQYREEAAWVSSLAEVEPRITGLVPWAPLEKGDAIRDELAALVEANPLTKGIRRIVQFESDAAFCLQPDFIKGVQLLSDFDLSFDICAKGEAQLKNCIELVKHCPNTQFILDHIGKPFIDRSEMQPWGELINQLADLTNIWCKVSGLVTEAHFDSWTPTDLKPYVDHVLNAFGIDRLVFGGDWPVVTQAASYTQWVDALNETTTNLSKSEKQKLFHDNAIAFYRLPNAAPTQEAN